MASSNHYPGKCLSVCAECGRAVAVPTAGGVPPMLEHDADCPRRNWPIQKAVKYDDGVGATQDNYSGPNGVEQHTIDVAELSRLSLGLVPVDEFSNGSGIGYGYGIAGPLTDEQVRTEAAERLAEITD